MKIMHTHMHNTHAQHTCTTHMHNTHTHTHLVSLLFWSSEPDPRTPSTSPPKKARETIPVMPLILYFTKSTTVVITCKTYFFYKYKYPSRHQFYE